MEDIIRIIFEGFPTDGYCPTSVVIADTNFIYIINLILSINVYIELPWPFSVYMILHYFSFNLTLILATIPLFYLIPLAPAPMSPSTSLSFPLPLLSS